MARSRLQIPLESITGDRISYVSPRERLRLLDTGLAEVVSARGAPERLKMTAESQCFNRGAASHTGSGEYARCHSVPHYPIPYVYEGHLTAPRASIINAAPVAKVNNASE